MRVLHRTEKEKTEVSLKLWEKCSKEVDIKCWGITVDDTEMLESANDYDLVIIDSSLDKETKLQFLLRGIADVVYHSGDTNNTVEQVVNCI